MSSLRVRALIKWIGKRGLYDAPRQLIDHLAALNPDGYAQVIRGLLAGADDQQRDAGMLLSLAAPQPDLYWDVLWGAIELEDPSWKRDAVLALIQLQPVPVIVADLLQIALHERWNPDITYSIERLFYWIGPPDLWDRPGAYRGYALKWLDGQPRWADSLAGLAVLWQSRELPAPRPERTAEMRQQLALYFAEVWGIQWPWG